MVNQTVVESCGCSVYRQIEGNPFLAAAGVEQLDKYMDNISNTPFATCLLQGSETVLKTEAREQTALPLQAGDICPFCNMGSLDYDGLLNLACPECGHSGGGGCYT